MTTQRQRLAAGYAASQQQVDEQRLRRRASTYRPDPQMERVLQLQREDLRAYATLGGSTRTAAALYAQTKHAADELQRLRQSDKEASGT